MNGDRLKEHLARFDEKGKYESLGLKQVRVIDFRAWNERGLSKLRTHPILVRAFVNDQKLIAVQLPDRKDIVNL